MHRDPTMSRNTVEIEIESKLRGSSVEDPLFYGTISMGKDDIPKFGSGRKILSEVEQLMEKNEALTTPLKGGKSCLAFL